MFRAITTVTIVGIAAYAAARRLLADDAPIERLPQPAREPAQKTRARLLRARNRARGILDEARAEQHRAEAELTAEYHRRARGGHSPDPLPSAPPEHT